MERAGTTQTFLAWC